MLLFTGTMDGLNLCIKFPSFFSGLGNGPAFDSRAMIALLVSVANAIKNNIIMKYSPEKETF